MFAGWNGDLIFPKINVILPGAIATLWNESVGCGGAVEVKTEGSTSRPFYPTKDHVRAVFSLLLFWNTDCVIFQSVHQNIGAIKEMK